MASAKRPSGKNTNEEKLARGNVRFPVDWVPSETRLAIERIAHATGKSMRQAVIDLIEEADQKMRISGTRKVSK